uniref:Uncharacterized protein n=1 Tax=Ditylenchus dipsaci TaxID=166011 RepID=A0A915DLT6_9BILA
MRKRTDGTEMEVKAPGSNCSACSPTPPPLPTQSPQQHQRPSTSLFPPTPPPMSTAMAAALFGNSTNNGFESTCDDTFYALVSFRSEIGK